MRLRVFSYRTFLYVLVVQVLIIIGVLLRLTTLDASIARQEYFSDKKGTFLSYESHYVIKTKGCSIPEFPLSHPDVFEYTYKEVEKLVCSNTSPLTEQSGLTLILHDERISEYGLFNHSFSCFYQGIERVTQDPNNYNISCDNKYRLKQKMSLFKKETVIDEDAILVSCYNLSNYEKPLYQNVHFFIQPRRAQKKRKMFQAEGVQREEWLSVIIMGTDAVSRANLFRHMPKTHSYLTHDLQAIDLRGLNKIADNTHPNIVAMLTGFSIRELHRHPCQKEWRKFDDCPFIWKDFSEQGYVTAYAEDTPHIGTFHHNMYGFVKEPVDYYNRPYYWAAENFTGHDANINGSVGYLCLGTRESISLIHNYSLAVAEELRDVPYFGFYWTTTMTHDTLQGALRADGPCHTYLKKMNEEGHLNHSILLFVSDHGLRYGNFRSTYAGMLEERLPYAYMVFPSWFHQKYPEAMRNLQSNTQKLTSTYDLYYTLKALLKREYVDIAYSPPNKGRGLSLFLNVSSKRTCTSAGIPAFYCACEYTNKANVNDPALKKSAKKSIQFINNSLKQFPDCSQLSLDKVLKGRKGRLRKGGNIAGKPSAVMFIVVFTTKPGRTVGQCKHIGCE